MSTRFAAALLLAAAGCASGSATTETAKTAAPSPNAPQFMGVESEHWLVQVTEPVGRDDILPAFAQSAKSYGCRTEKLGAESRHNIHGEMRSYYGVSASCDEGTIALITLADGSVSIGCAKPTTPQACDQLLRSISESR